MRRLLLGLAVLAAGCTTLSGARPLAPGEHELGAVLGGGLVEFGGPMPLPNIVVGGRSGIAVALERNLDLQYGLNLTALPFGIAQGHIGVGWFLVGDTESPLALAGANRLFLASNLITTGEKELGSSRFWAADQLELIGSLRTGNHVHSLSLAQYFDFGRPSLTLTPALGTALDFGQSDGFILQAELRWYGIHRMHELDAVTWIPGRPGILGISIGTSVRF
jgi:hypothetical protein